MISNLHCMQTAGISMKEAVEAMNKLAMYSYACGYNNKVTGFASHAEGYSSLHCVQPTVVEEALDRYSSSHKVSTTDVLEKIQKEIEEWLKDPGINCQANLIDK